MKVSDAGLAFIAREEGTVLHVYIDQVGVPTIGVGHALKPGEKFPNGITQAQAMDILSKDIAHVEEAINSFVTVMTLTQNQFDAMASFAFNLGTGALRGSTLLKYVNQGKFQEAADEFLKWDHGGGRELPVLKARRERERALFLQGIVFSSTPAPVPQPDPPPAPPVVVPSAPEPAPVVPVPVVVQSPVASPTSGSSGIFGLIMMLINFFLTRGH